MSDGEGAMRRSSRIMIAALMMVGSACAHRGSRTDSIQSLPVRVRVINHYALQIDVVAEAGGTSYHVGTVSPGIDSRYVLRPSLLALGPVQLIVLPRDDTRPFLTESLLLSPGDEVTLEITPSLFNSTVTVEHE